MVNQNSNQNGKKNGGEKIYVQIDWIRHGFSCSNAMGSLNADTVWSIISTWEVKKHKYAKDAKLTDLGISQAQLANKKFFNRYKNFDMICCSQLRRAMETAEILFNGINKDIFVLPYVNEVRHNIGKVSGLNGQSIPTDWKVRKSEVVSKFNWIFFETLGIDQFAEHSVSNFYQRLMPLIVYMLRKRERIGKWELGTSKRPIRLAIVSHQLFIRKVLDIKNKIGNTGIWAEQIIYNLKKRAVEKSLAKRVVYKPEYIIFNGKKVVYSGDVIEAKYLSKKSIERCDILEKIDVDKLAR